MRLWRAASERHAVDCSDCQACSQQAKHQEGLCRCLRTRVAAQLSVNETSLSSPTAAAKSICIPCSGAAAAAHYTATQHKASRSCGPDTNQTLYTKSTLKLLLMYGWFLMVLLALQITYNSVCAGWYNPGIRDVDLQPMLHRASSLQRSATAAIQQHHKQPTWYLTSLAIGSCRKYLNWKKIWGRIRPNSTAAYVGWCSPPYKYAATHSCEEHRHADAHVSLGSDGRCDPHASLCSVPQMPAWSVVPGTVRKVAPEHCQSSMLTSCSHSTRQDTLQAIR